VRGAGRPAAASRSGSDFDPALLEGLGVPVRRLTLDSRRIRPGDTFLAFAGEAEDGRNYIAQAIAGGASAVLWENHGFRWNAAWSVPNLGVAGLRAKAGAIASHVYGRPSEKLWVIGATGTNGKTTCTHWIAQAMESLGRRTAVIGTLGSGFPDELAPARITTPDPLALQESLAGFLAQGASCVAMEVSSHALDQGRVNGVRFAVALFTNLTRDHLDYHGTMERYAAAKARLFQWPRLKHAVLNLDDAFGRQLAGRIQGGAQDLLGYGFGPEALDMARGTGLALVRGASLQLAASGIRFSVESPWGDAEVASPMLGRFNAENLLATLATLLASGAKLHEALRALEAIRPVAGRLQQFGGGEQPLVVVDYAHTPDAMDKALSALRELLREQRDARLICVFGCGGDRDRGKRPLMGEVATRLADLAVVTSDNPRGEDPRAIIEDVVSGMGANYRVVMDRATAIYEAISGARRHDVVLIAGKGHEQYQEIGGERLPFSDAAVARKALDIRISEGQA
jgi:UDP-N-acetylmuramoyl-L-alanyl-D-glutamate--2,6-diaminopimelate ligase